MPSSQQEANPFLHFTRRLDQAGIRYMVSGSIAAMAYGEPRLTNDIDLIVSLDLPEAIRLSKLFPPDQFYFPPIDVIASELTRERRGHFNILHIDTGFKADVYLRGSDPLRIWALERVRPATFGDFQIPIAPPEYVIIRKLEYFREGGSEKHLRDIAMMLQNSVSQIDISQLETMIVERNLSAEWQKAKSVGL